MFRFFPPSSLYSNERMVTVAIEFKYIEMLLIMKIQRIGYRYEYSVNILILMHYLRMNGVLGHDSALKGCTGLGTKWANKINSIMNDGPGAGSIIRSVDHQSSTLPMCYE